MSNLASLMIAALSMTELRSILNIEWMVRFAQEHKIKTEGQIVKFRSDEVRIHEALQHVMRMSQNGTLPDPQFINLCTLGPLWFY